MNKLLVSLAFLFVGFTILSSLMEGAGGMIATRLSGDVTATVATIPVTTTNGFVTANDYVVIGNEKILYTGVVPAAFTGCTRGYNNTEATAHLATTTVYSSEASVLNNALGFNIATTASTAGAFSLIMIPYKFLTQSVPKLIMFDYSFFSGQMVYAQIFFQVVGVGFAITMAIWVINAVMGIFRP